MRRERKRTRHKEMEKRRRRDKAGVMKSAEELGKMARIERVGQGKEMGFQQREPLGRAALQTSIGLEENTQTSGIEAAQRAERFALQTADERRRHVEVLAGHHGADKVGQGVAVELLQQHLRSPLHSAQVVAGRPVLHDGQCVECLA